MNIEILLGDWSFNLVSIALNDFLREIIIRLDENSSLIKVYGTDLIQKH